MCHALHARLRAAFARIVRRRNTAIAPSWCIDAPCRTPDKAPPCGAIRTLRDPARGAPYAANQSLAAAQQMARVLLWGMPRGKDNGKEGGDERVADASAGHRVGE
jgi:hypothetical protein